jgi:hypothetical protein
MPYVEIAPHNLKALYPMREELHRIENYDEGIMPPDRKLQKIAAFHGSQYLGGGKEVIALTQDGPFDTALVLAINHWVMKPNEAKTLYYSQRILQTLFPHNFPHIYAAFGSWAQTKSGDDISGTIREYIEGPHRNRRIWQAEDNLKHIDKYSEFPFSQAWECIQELELPYQPPDTGGNNFIIGSDGGTYYVDVLQLKWSRRWNIPQLLECMRNSDFCDSQIAIVINSIYRLHAMNPQWDTILNENYQEI